MPRKLTMQFCIAGSFTKALDKSRPFPWPESGRFAVKVINHFGDEVMKVFGV